MKVRNFIMSILIMNILVISFAFVAFADQKEGLDEVHVKKTAEDIVEEDVLDYLKKYGENLPIGVLKNIIRDANFSESSIEDLKVEGIYNRLLVGVASSHNIEPDQGIYQIEIDGIEGELTDIYLYKGTIAIEGREYFLPEKIIVRTYLFDEGTLDDLEVGKFVRLRINEDIAIIEEINENYVNVKGNITGLDIDKMIVEINYIEYILPQKFEVKFEIDETTLEDLEVGMIVTLKIEDKKAEIEVISE